MFNKKFLVDDFLDEDALDRQALRNGFGEAVVELGEENEDIVVLNADLPGSLRVPAFEEKFPERTYQVGIAEQAMAGIGTGLALYGKIPFITTFASFSPGINWANIRTAAMSHANLKIASSHYGLNVGADGASAQMLADIALMRVLPNMVVLSPADFNQTKQAISAAAEHDGCVYIRFTREKFPVFLKAEVDFEIGKAQVLKEGKDITVLATGSVVYEAVKTVEALEEKGVDAELINIHTVKPIDKEAIVRSVKKTGKMATIEEHYNAGGMGSAAIEAISQESPVPTLQLGVDDEFGRSGDGFEVMKAYGLHRDSFVERIEKFV
jgi:transketolase